MSIVPTYFLHVTYLLEERGEYVGHGVDGGNDNAVEGKYQIAPQEIPESREHRGSRLSFLVACAALYSVLSDNKKITWYKFTTEAQRHRVFPVPDKGSVPLCLCGEIP